MVEGGYWNRTQAQIDQSYDLDCHVEEAVAGEFRSYGVLVVGRDVRHGRSVNGGYRGGRQGRCVSVGDPHISLAITRSYTIHCLLRANVTYCI
jgi:hypothetical protein